MSIHKVLAGSSRASKRRKFCFASSGERSSPICVSFTEISVSRVSAADSFQARAGSAWQRFPLPACQECFRQMGQHRSDIPVLQLTRRGDGVIQSLSRHKSRTLLFTNAYRLARSRNQRFCEAARSNVRVAPSKSSIVQFPCFATRRVQASRL